MALTMNSPFTKYAPKELVFFNYHEYLSEEYTPHSLAKTRDSVSLAEPPALVINHFPNPYIPGDSDLFTKTRIVRIPRIFDTCEDLYMTPQFSSYHPGKEPGAITSDQGSLCEGKYLGHFFGFSSLSPLSRWITEEELSEIVSTINKLLLEAYSPGGLSGFENGLDFITGTLYSTLYLNLVKASRQKNAVDEVNKYISLINLEMLSGRHALLKLVPVTTSALLSLDFQIPAPVI